jgi:hypothetical protein
MIDFAELPDYRFTYNEAFLYCITLSYNGHKDWRMPTHDEYMNCKEIASESFDDSDDPKDIKAKYPIVPVRDVN